MADRGVASEAGERPFPSAAIGWTTLFVLLLLAIVAYLDRQILSLLVDPIRHDLKITDFQVGLLQGFAFAILYSVFGLPLGWAVDRYQRRLVIFFGVSVWCLATMSAGLAQSYGQLLTARIFVGMGEAALSPAAYSMISDLFPKRRLAFVLSVYMIGQQLGSTVALWVGSAAITWAAHGITLPLFGTLSVWQATFVVCGIPGLLIGLLVFTVPEPARRTLAHEAGTWREFFVFFKARRSFFLLHFAGFSLAMMIAYAIIFWVPVILSRRYGWPVAQVGLYYGLFTSSVGIVGLLINGRLVDHLLSRGVKDAHMRYYAWCCLGVIVTAIGVVFAPTGALFLLALAPVKLLFQFTGVSAAALQIVTPNALRGRVSAVYLLVISLLGITVGPASVGFFTDYVFRDDAKVALSLAAAFAVMGPLAGLLFWLGMKPMRAAMEAATP